MPQKARKITVSDNSNLSCLVCENDEFLVRSAQLNTAAMSLLGLDWADQSATCYVCDRCGYVHWFLPNRKSLD